MDTHQQTNGTKIIFKPVQIEEVFRADLSRKIRVDSVGKEPRDVTYLGPLYTSKLNPMPIQEVYEFINPSSYHVLSLGLQEAVKRNVGKKVLVKKYVKHSMTNDQIVLVRNEISLYMQLTHPSILMILDVFESDEMIYTIFDFIDGVDLHQYTSKVGIVSPIVLQDIARQILLILRYLQSMKIVHRDICSSNFMMVHEEGESPVIMLKSFQFARVVNRSYKAEGVCGSIDFIAPEMLLGDYGLSVDLWSLGVLCYTLACGCTPFQGSPAQKIEAISKIEVNRSRPQFKNLPADCIAFINSLLCESSRRATVESALDDAFFINANPTSDLMNMEPDCDCNEEEIYQSITTVVYPGSLLIDCDPLVAHYFDRLKDHTCHRQRDPRKRLPVEHRQAFMQWHRSGYLRKTLLLLYAFHTPQRDVRHLLKLYVQLSENKPVLKTLILQNKMCSFACEFSDGEAIIESMDFYGTGWIPSIVWIACHIGTALLPVVPDILASLLRKLKVDDRGEVSHEELISLLGTKSLLRSMTQETKNVLNEKGNQLRLSINKNAAASTSNGPGENFDSTDSGTTKIHSKTSHITTIRDLILTYPLASGNSLNNDTFLKQTARQSSSTKESGFYQTAPQMDGYDGAQEEYITRLLQKQTPDILV